MCHAVTHLVRAHAPAVSVAAAALHDKLIRHAVFHGLAPPPDSPPSAVQRAATLLHLPTRLGGHGFTSALATAPAAFLASALEAFAALVRALLPHFGSTDLATDRRPSFVALRAAHADVLQALSSVECGYAALDSSACYVDAFGEPHSPFRPVGLPSFATQPPDPDDDDDPLVGGSPGPRADARPDDRLRPLRCILPLAAYLDLPSTRYKCAQRAFSAVLHHAAWLRLLLSGSQRDCALLVSMSQRGAHDFHHLHAPLSDPRSHVPSAIFRLGLLYHLGLPIPGLGSADPLGDAAVCTAHHSARHTAVLSAWHQAARAAHTTACAIREPADHSAYSPGKRPDLYVTHLNLALDVKTASLFTSSASLASARLAAHTPVVATAEPFYLKAFGDPRSGSSGEYSRAVGFGTTASTSCSPR